MNNKGLITALFTIMLGVVIIILALAFAPALNNSINDVRNQTSENSLTLNCFSGDGVKNNTLNDYEEANCIASDLITPAFIFVLIGVAGVIIGAKLII